MQEINKGDKSHQPLLSSLKLKVLKTKSCKNKICDEEKETKINLAHEAEADNKNDKSK